MKCVNGCGNMSEVSYEGVPVDICNSCKGIWLDATELSTIVKTKEKTWSKNVVKMVMAETGVTGVPEVEEDRSIDCPKCGGDMPPNNYQNNSGIIINACKKRHGIWLDAGELSRIQIFMEKWEELAKKDSEKYAVQLDDVESEFIVRETESKLELQKQMMARRNMFRSFFYGGYDF